jgi:glutamine amidotransferase
MMQSAKYSDGQNFSAAFERGNVFATQFHPEKSGEAGLQILSKFARRTAR